MNHDLLHIQGKPYVLVPLHEYRSLSGKVGATELPQEVLDAVFARQEHPLKILRRHRGMTQDALAAAAGVSRPYLTEIETGKKEGSIAAMKAIAGALSISPGLLL